MKTIMSLLLLSFMAVSSYGMQINKSAFSGKNFWYIDQIDRVEIITDLYKQTKAEYALWEVKKKRIGVDGDMIFKEAIEAEQSIADVDDAISQARSNMEFYDRARKLIASFQDTHFGLNTHIAAPWIVSGFNTKLVADSGKVIIASKYAKVIEKSVIETQNYNLKMIELGDELISVDGVKVSDAIEALMPYIDASSPAFARSRAAAMLIERYFLFPTKPYFDIEFKSEKTQTVYKTRLPLYYSGNTSIVRKKDISFYLEQKGFLKLKELRFKWDNQKRTFVKDTSLKVETLPEGLPTGAIELENWTSANGGGSPIVRSALILKDAKAYAYMQVNSFSVSTVYYKGEQLSFIEALRKNIKFFKAQNLNLILDIRNNGGGNGGYPAQLLAMLTEQGQSYPNATWASAVTRYMRQLIEYYGVEEIFKDIGGSDWTMQSDAFFEAAAEGRTLSRATQNYDITADPQVGGFDGKIVALVSPNCISACDITSILLQGSKRAKLIGTHANGTGAGYRSNDVYNTQFKDRYNVFSTQIPNMLFGYGVEGHQFGDLLGIDSAYELNSENVPVQADVNYVETKKDLTNYMSGWIEKAIEVLNAE
ncbi:S41 family peptidase [Halobacteriovorax sp. HFRX-2_2]|uniref:S41 family peptidase n=1 Tax=unclassified Halobacteriovorax TaxID=2639665 RepID=UPI0037108711